MKETVITDCRPSASNQAGMPSMPACTPTHHTSPPKVALHLHAISHRHLKETGSNPDTMPAPAERYARGRTSKASTRKPDAPNAALRRAPFQDLRHITLSQVCRRDYSRGAMCVRNVDVRVLQFTRRHAVCCVLHRPTSRVIHRLGFSIIPLSHPTGSPIGFLHTNSAWRTEQDLTRKEHYCYSCPSPCDHSPTHVRRTHSHPTYDMQCLPPFNPACTWYCYTFSTQQRTDTAAKSSYKFARYTTLPPRISKVQHASTQSIRLEPAHVHR
jgi:hypothetical protein